jgi:hypothetical protein
MSFVCVRGEVGSNKTMWVVFGKQVCKECIITLEVGVLSFDKVCGRWIKKKFFFLLKIFLFMILIYFFESLVKIIFFIYLDFWATSNGYNISSFPFIFLIFLFIKPLLFFLAGIMHVILYFLIFLRV